MCIASCVSLCFLSTVGSGPSGGEGEVSLESVKALGLLVTGMDGSGVVRPLEELATLQSEAKAAGFSKVYTTARARAAYLGWHACVAVQCAVDYCWLMVVADTDVQDRQVVVLVVPVSRLEPVWPLLHAGGTEGQEDCAVSFCCQEREGADQHFTVSRRVRTTC